MFIYIVPISLIGKTSTCNLRIGALPNPNKAAQIIQWHEDLYHSKSSLSEVKLNRRPFLKGMVNGLGGSVVIRLKV